VQRVQQRYDRTRDLKGKFKQVYSDRLYGRERISYGYLFVKKPGMMRWNYASPERKAFISDGKVLWVWEPADKQAFRNPLDDKSLSSGLAFLLGAGRLADTFDVGYATEARDRIGGDGQLVLKLTPKKPTAQYDYLVLVVRPSDHAVVESMVVTPHATNRMIFSELVFNSRLQDHRFRFRPDPETRVIDGSASKEP
jgi:outer membrane lipoprotein carrier protein